LKKKSVPSGVGELNGSVSTTTGQYDAMQANSHDDLSKQPREDHEHGVYYVRVSEFRIQVPGTAASATPGELKCGGISFFLFQVSVCFF